MEVTGCLAEEQESLHLLAPSPVALLQWFYIRELGQWSRARCLLQDPKTNMMGPGRAPCPVMAIE